ALASPKEETGALCQCGSFLRACARNSASRGQSGQSRPGSERGKRPPALPAAESFLIVEIVVAAPWCHRGGALQELPRGMTRLTGTALARSRALGRIAAKLRLQLNEIGEHVGLTPQLVGDHRRLARDRRDHGDANATALHGLDQRTEIAVAGEQNHLVD